MTDRERIARILTLPLKREYFEAIRDGHKLEEYREQTDYWKKRLVGRDYDYVTLTLGYPNRDDMSRRITFPYRGYLEKTINHPHFGNVDTPVFAIPVKPKDRLMASCDITFKDD